MNKVFVEDFEKIQGKNSAVFEKLRGSTVLVTGACGMIASYLCLLLLYYADEYDITVYVQCRNKAKAEKIFAEYTESERFHFAEFSLSGKIPENVKYDYIIHAASHASTYYFINTPVEVMEPNIIGTWNLLQYAKEQGSSLVFFSSNSVYGEGGTDKTLLSETDLGIVDPLGERSSYVESKRCAEQLCSSFSKEYGVKTAIARICHTYGPTFDIENDGRIIPKTIKRMLSGEDVVIVKDPDSIIQYTYVGDIAAAVLYIMTAGASGEAYNTCGDETICVDDAIRNMMSVVKDGSSKLIEKEMDNSYAFGKGKGINFIKIDNAKLRSLGWESIFPNEEGFCRTAERYITEKG